MIYKNVVDGGCSVGPLERLLANLSMQQWQAVADKVYGSFKWLCEKYGSTALTFRNWSYWITIGNRFFWV